MRTYEENHALNQTLHSPHGRTRAYMTEERPREYITTASRVKFFGDRRWWNVRTFNKKFVVLTRTGDFGRSDVYTIIAWNEGRRGPHNSWGHSTETDKDCRKTLKALKKQKIELSERRSIYLDIKEIDL